MVKDTVSDINENYVALDRFKLNLKLLWPEFTRGSEQLWVISESKSLIESFIRSSGLLQIHTFASTFG